MIVNEAADSIEEVSTEAAEVSEEVKTEAATESASSDEEELEVNVDSDLNWDGDFARYGNATASLCVQGRGGIPAIPTKEEVEELLGLAIC